MNLYQILIKPIVTEKTSRETEMGKLTFIINKNATKIDIQNAIQTLYGVKVTKVNIRPTPAKKRVVGRGTEITKRANVRKATVTLEKGKTIDIYKFKK